MKLQPTSSKAAMQTLTFFDFWARLTPKHSSPNPLATESFH